MAGPDDERAFARISALNREVFRVMQARGEQASAEGDQATRDEAIVQIAMCLGWADRVARLLFTEWGEPDATNVRIERIRQVVRGAWTNPPRKPGE